MFFNFFLIRFNSFHTINSKVFCAIGNKIYRLYHTGITIAGSHGHFELNVFKPMIAHNILQSIDLIADSTRNFAIYCVKGIKANKKRIKEHLDNSLMLVTALAPHIGYDNAAKIAKTALQNGTKLKYETLKTRLIKEKDYDRIVDPKKMIYPA